MPVIGRGYDHRVDVFARQHLAVIAGGEHGIAVQFAGTCQPAVVDVTDRGKFDARLGQGVSRIAHPHSAEADGGDADAIVGRNRLLRVGEKGRARAKEEASRGHGGYIVAPAL
jgi:hypothetical protein